MPKLRTVSALAGDHIALRAFEAAQVVRVCQRELQRRAIERLPLQRGMLKQLGAEQQVAGNNAKATSWVDRSRSCNIASTSRPCQP